ncbi:MAG: lipase [Pirellulaceae bacterium]|nr:lipase [Pirellulaceae bacterium]
MNEPSHNQMPSNPKRGTPTLGGKQFWTDFRWWHGLRLQQNQVTRHWRVLSAQDRRVASGDLKSCLRLYREQRSKISELPADRVVVLVHGLMRTSSSLKRLGRYLETQGWSAVVDFRYASSRATISCQAAALHSVIKHLPGAPRLSFVGHSLGNIVIRHMIGDWQRSANGMSFLDRLDRIVMLAPPNQGAAIARALGYTGLFQLITGRAGTQLGSGWPEIESRLAVPPCPVAIIAGDASIGKWNPLVPAPSDLVVAVAETSLPTVKDHMIVPAIHSFIMENKRVQEATAKFLNGMPLPEA